MSGLDDERVAVDVQSELLLRPALRDGGKLSANLVVGAERTDREPRRVDAGLGQHGLAA